MNLFQKKEKIRKEAKIINDAIDSIDRVETKIHRIHLSGYKFGYEHIEEKTGANLKVINSIFNEKGELTKKNRRPYVIHGTYRIPEDKFNNIKNTQITFFLGPLISFMPWVIFETSYPNKNFLIKEIDSKFNNQLFDGKTSRVIVSSLEYTIDVYPKHDKDIRAIYHTMLKYLYLPYQRDNVKLVLSDYRNSRFRCGRSQLYTRGKDCKKRNGGWDKEDEDRIRLEFRANRYYLKKFGIGNLYDFIMETPKFKEMMMNRFKFKRFKTKKLFKKQMRKGNVFQSLYFGFKKIYGKSIYQHTKEVEEWDRLKELFIPEMVKFDRDWELEEYDCSNEQDYEDEKVVNEK